MPRGDRRWSTARAALAVILLLVSSALYPGNKEGSNPLPTREPSANQFAVTVEDLSTFLEPALNMQRALFGIPGAAVAVVQGEKTLYLGGFGKANLASSERTDVWVSGGSRPLLGPCWSCPLCRRC
jgi:hypothetical protein